MAKNLGLELTGKEGGCMKVKIQLTIGVITAIVSIIGILWLFVPCLFGSSG